MLAGTAGLSLQTAGFEIEPYAGARYIDLDLDGFTETGNIAALTIGDSSIEIRCNRSSDCVSAPASRRAARGCDRRSGPSGGTSSRTTTRG